MKLHTAFTSITTALLLGSGAAYADTCMPIGGVGMPNLSPQVDGSIRITAPLMGSFSAASGTITAQRKTKTGLEMDLNHYFINDKGGFFHTTDHAVLSKVKEGDSHYMIEITYQIDDGSTSGVLDGYRGSFNSYGLVDLSNLEGVVRYSGEICKSVNL
ncbi:MAG: hypothetical protein ACI93R_002746 [Flavobacteriales bacterium]|jgi:hypothetical protein